MLNLNNLSTLNFIPRKPGGDAPDLTLNTYPGAAAAYSTRKLDKNYAGSAISVRRSSDNVEQDIVFTSGGDLDEVALTSFVEANDGFVTTWYDQSGNGNDATQGTASKQPKIVSAGTVVKENVEPALLFDGIDDELQTGNVIGHSGETSSFAVINFDNPNPNQNPYGIIQIGSVNEPVLLFIQNNLSEYGYRYLVDEDAEKTFSTRGIQVALTGITTNGGVVSIYENGVKGIDSTYTPNSIILSRPLSIGSLNGTFYFTNHIQELIFYPSDQSANRTGIEGNINSYYNIY